MTTNQTRTCEVCNAPYTPIDPKQKYCSKDCKKAFEKVLSKLISECRQPLLNAARDLLKLRKYSDDWADG